jgi:hypothetical protein
MQVMPRNGNLLPMRPHEAFEVTPYALMRPLRYGANIMVEHVGVAMK